MTTIIDPTLGITLPDGSQIGTAQSLGMRNRIINGGMAIDQRNSGAANTAGGYCVDRMFFVNGSGTGVIQAQQGAYLNYKSLTITATTAVTALTAGNYVQSIQYRMEGQSCYDLNGKTVTLSFSVQANWAGNLAVCIQSGAGNRSYVTDVAIISGLNNVVVTFPLEAATVSANNNAVGMQISIGFQNNGTYQTATKNAWIAGNFQCSTTTTNWCTTLNNYINVTNLQFEVGSVATPFEQRIIGLELFLCQRYGESVGVLRYEGYGNAGNVFSAFKPFKVTKRIAPTLTGQSALTSTNCAIGTLAADITEVTAPISVTATGALVAQIVGMFASAEL